MFAYHFKEEYPTDGWMVYDPVDELMRFVSGIITYRSHVIVGHEGFP